MEEEKDVEEDNRPVTECQDCKLTYNTYGRTVTLNQMLLLRFLLRLSLSRRLRIFGRLRNADRKFTMEEVTVICATWRLS